MSTRDSDAQLLRRFVREGAQDAFAELVRRHLGLVYSAALRQVDGDAALAQDVAQAVFLDLARKAGALADRDVLAGWLYTSTHHAAANALRAERRRRRREQEAYAMQETENDSARDADWARVRAVLDDAMQDLSARDRDAILLRFFQGLGFPEIAAQLQLSESGARMRVERALEKLHARLGRKGIRSTMGALASVLAAEAVAAPPAGLAASLAIVATTGAGGAAAATAGWFTFMGMTKTQTSIVAVVAAAGLGTAGWQNHQRAALRTELAELRTSAPAVDAGADAIDIAADPGVPRIETLRDEAAEAVRLRRETAEMAARLQQAPAPSAAARPARNSNDSNTGVAEKIYDIQELEATPQPTYQVNPVYPFEMQKAGIPGDVIVSFVITPDGRARDVVVEDATHPDFGVSAVDAVEKWRYRPGRKDGAPVGVRMRMPMRFQIGNTNWF